MPDNMDAIQDLVLRQQEDALAKAERSRVQQPGLDECAKCDVPISSLRKGLGARLCLECQAAHERAQRGVPRVAV